MNLRIRFFATFRELFGFAESEIKLPVNSDVGRLLNRICDTPERREALFQSDGHLGQYIKILVNGRNIQFLKDLRTRLTDGDVVSVFPPIGGG